MFNSKKREIERLQSRLDEAEPYFPIAQAIGSRVTEQVAELNGDPDLWLESILDEVAEDKRLEVLQLLFNELPPEDRLDLLGKYFAGNEFQQALESERQRVLELERNRNTLDGWAAEAKEKGFFDLNILPEDMRIKLELYSTVLLSEDETIEEVTKYEDPTRVLRAITRGDGNLHLLEDTTEYGEKTVPPLFVHQQIRLGCSLGYSDNSEFSTRIYLGSELHCLMGWERSSLKVHSTWGETEDLVVGQLEVNGVEFFPQNNRPEDI